MKEIKAFIRPDKVNKIVEQLKASGFENITISEAEGTGRFRSENAFVSQKFLITDSKIAKLELVAKDENVDKIIEIISENGKTINPGDGLIYVACVEKAYRVKTGKENGYK
ncbi:MAG: P-II family nitrogen regulator [Bacteroidales bacterium]|nr:P-II family nitrogen regulator [Bacteroidales bacterium]